MSIRMDRVKMDKILGLVEKIRTENPSNAQVLTLIEIVTKCIGIVDDIQEDIVFYEEELDRLRFEKEDRSLERSGIYTNPTTRRRGQLGI